MLKTAELYLLSVHNICKILEQAMKTCLIFGGNGFIGFETLTRIIDNHEIDIILANRGNSWDWDKRARLEYIMKNQGSKPPPDSHLKYFRVNRIKPFSQAVDFMQHIDSLPCIDFVLDFSGYGKSEVEETLKIFGPKIRRYIYMSTDSVYEVCEKHSNGYAKETDAVRPKCKEKRKKYDKKDYYGKQKLDCEEFIREYSDTAEDFSYTFLRLSDVVGFRDSTNRWLEYLLWVKVACQLNIPIYLPKEVEHRPISLVYSNEIGDLINRILSGDILCQSKNEEFNLAFSETVEVEEVVHCMCSAIGCKSRGLTKFSEEAPQFYPSVEKGPVDCSKARSLLQWSPRPFKEACHEIVGEYELCLRCETGNTDMWEGAQELLTDVEELYDKSTLNQIEKLLKDFTHQ